MNVRLARRLRTAVVLGLPLVAVLAVIVVVATGTSSGPQPRRIESLFQDDQLLLYSPRATVLRTLQKLKALGADRVRLTIIWADIAPADSSPVPPAGFDPTNPADYPATSWPRYDTVVALAKAIGIGVDFDVSAPGPLWAMTRPAPGAKAATHYGPSAAQFKDFMIALGRRYSGSYIPAGTAAKLPRVDYWSIWNEPNQPGWLLPQWRRGSIGYAMQAPSLYRQLIDAGYGALVATGHSQKTDTILIGELAPEGAEQPGPQNPIPPMKFLRALYCVGNSYLPLEGTQATRIGCPAHNNPGTFVTQHPGLFDVTGFAQHPYSFFLPPSVKVPDRNFVPLANLARLEGALDSLFATYAPDLSLPVYLTEYSYETNPPNPYRGVSLKTQALYLDEAEYMVWQDPRVHSMSQFLLVDSAPDRRYRPGSPQYWSTFQTGLEFLGGAQKPSLAAYRLPIYLPHPVIRAGRSTLVWGMLRAAPNNTRQSALIQWRPVGGSYRTLKTITTTNANGFFTQNLAFPSSGNVRIAWRSAAGRIFYSRNATITVS